MSDPQRSAPRGARRAAPDSHADGAADDLLSAYVDGVGELTPEERRRVEHVLAEPAARAAETATRELLGELRELPRTGNEPDWAALERSISEAVGPVVPRAAWWRRSWRSRSLAFALAATAAIVVLVSRMDREPAQVVVDTPEPMPVVVAEDPEPVFAVYLDGETFELDLADEDLIEDEFDADVPDDLATPELLAPDDLAWVDEIADDDLDRVEGWLLRRGRG